MQASDNINIGARTLRGVLWAYGSYGSGRALVLVSTAILAHLLGPDEFGLVAIALLFVAVLEGISDLGLTQALVVQDEKDLMDRAETVFVSAVVLGFLTSALMAACSPLIGSFFGEPEVTGLAAALAGAMFLRSIGATHMALAQKRLDFKARTAGELSEVVVRGVVGIGLAIAGAGAWSLVIGFLAGIVALDIAIWIAVGWRPRFKPRREHLRPLAGFGAKLSAVDVIATVISNIDYLLIGKVLGPVALGLYTLAYRLPELLIANLSLVAGEVLFASYTKVDRAELGEAFLKAMRFTVMLSAPLAAGVAIMAEPLVLTLFGEQWREAIPVMRWLAALSFVLTIGVPAGTVYKATGRAGILAYLAALRLLGLTGALLLFVELGIEAAAICQLVVAVFFEAAAITIAVRILGSSWSGIARAAVPGLAATALMAVPVAAAALLIGPNVLAIAAAAVGGGATYMVAIRLIARDSLEYVLDRLRPSPAPDPSDLAGEAHGTSPSTVI